MIGSVEWDSAEERGRGRHQRKASIIHGWVVKMRGTFFGSEATRRAGIREMRDAHAIRRYKKEHPERFRGGGGGRIFWIFPRRAPRHENGHGHHERSRSRGHGHHDGRHHSSDRHHHDRPHRSHSHAYHGEAHRGQFLHFPHRVKPHHHGVGTWLAGIFSGRRHLKDKGRHIRERAEKERRRERRRRRRQRRDEGLALKIDGTINKNRWWHR
ncbi:uncharacterized protein BXZ73DRAFT_102763 [Epithele typhae]|uniref:uncharacterized protein n=1 Tax=Epithele typhae TaxID=378194 RepID=UPI0020087F46|nr:uncharacterized protein BXZ73DRAFT_102763 [Epithele typhae]KAH9927175.1 hypothetical protein BXZ73DRAFT_102763 [Epithele typhae]